MRKWNNECITQLFTHMTTSSGNFQIALGYDVADKRIDILRRIDETGSISEAARSAKVSYKAAWQAIDTLSNLAGTPLVIKAVGGSGGGGAQLTAAGQQLLLVASMFAQAKEQVLSNIRDNISPDLNSLGLSSLGVKTSMRNHLPCKIKQLEKINHVVRVTLELGKNTFLHSTITEESAQLLGLKRHLDVLALCKATGVYIASQIESRPGVNLLSGIVTRSTSSLKGGEVSIEIIGGKRLSGIALPDNRLLTGDSVFASVPESSVVIALLG